MYAWPWNNAECTKCLVPNYLYTCCKRRAEPSCCDSRRRADRERTPGPHDKARVNKLVLRTRAKTSENQDLSHRIRMHARLNLTTSSAAGSVTVRVMLGDAARRAVRGGVFDQDVSIMSVCVVKMELHLFLLLLIRTHSMISQDFSLDEKVCRSLQLETGCSQLLYD